MSPSHVTKITVETPLIIGLCGPIGSGKTTVARQLAAALCDVEPVIVQAMAKPMRDMLTAIGIPAASVHGNQIEKHRCLDLLQGKSIRDALQTLGTDWGRNMIGEDFWVDLWHHATGSYAIRICDDVRFQNEIDSIRNAGGYVLCLNERGDVDHPAAQHVSEGQLLDVDHFVSNSGTVQETVDYIMFWLGMHQSLRTKRLQAI